MILIIDGDFDGWWFWIIDSWWRCFSFQKAAKDAADDSEVEALAQHVWQQAI